MLITIRVDVCAQIRYSVREYACKVVDVLARRTRLAFLNVQAAEEAMPRIIEIMAEELNWTSDRIKVGSVAMAGHGVLVVILCGV